MIIFTLIYINIPELIMKKLFTISVLTCLMLISGLTFASKNSSRIYRPKSCPIIREIQQADIINLSDTGLYFAMFVTTVPGEQRWALLINNIEPANPEDFLSQAKLAISTISANPVQEKSEREITCTYPTPLLSKSGKPLSIFILPFNAFIVG